MRQRNYDAEVYISKREAEGGPEGVKALFYKLKILHALELFNTYTGISCTTGPAGFASGRPVVS